MLFHVVDPLQGSFGGERLTFSLHTHYTLDRGEREMGVVNLSM